MIFLNKAIGFIGSAVKELEPKKARTARALGKTAAQRNFVVFSGACTGYPLEAVKGAKESGTITIGISPATNLSEHKNNWNYPVKEFDSLVFTGMGRARNFLLVRSCSALIVLEGRVGTLNEVSSAFDEGKIIGTVKGFGGISSHLPQLKEWFSGKKTGAKIVIAGNPEELIERIESLL